MPPPGLAGQHLAAHHPPGNEHRLVRSVAPSNAVPPGQKVHGLLQRPGPGRLPKSDPSLYERMVSSQFGTNRPPFIRLHVAGGVGAAAYNLLSSQ